MWSTVEIAPETWFIQRNWLSCNHFVAKSPRPILIDTGFKDDLADTVAALRSLGLEPEDIELIVNTHCHCDHAGGNRFFSEKSGCEIWMHTHEKDRIDRRDDIGTWWRFHDTWAEFFTVDRGLGEGDEVRFGPLTLEVLYAPGHSRGLMMLYSEQTKALFSADAIWQGDMGVINPIVEGEDALARAIETLERIDRLDIETVFPGHGPVIRNPKPAIDRLFRRLSRYGKDPSAMHVDHLKKMIAYVILMKGRVIEADFFDYVKGTVWFPQLVDRYFASGYGEVYEMAIQESLRSGMIRRENGHLFGVAKK